MNTLKTGSRGSDVIKLQRALNLYADGIFGKLTEEAVKDFQKSKGLTADGIVGAKTWIALGISDASAGIVKSQRTINELIVHCTASKEGVDLTVDQIRQMHKKNGWSDIGYHYVVYRDGSLHTGRNVDIAGAHCEGHNSHSIGIVYVGGLDSNGKAKDTRTEAQKKTLLSLLRGLKGLYPKAKIMGHRSVWGEDTPAKWKKQCPCFNAVKEYKDI